MARDKTFYKGRPSFTVRDIGTPVMIEFKDETRGKVIATFTGFRLLPATGADANLEQHERTEVTLERVINGVVEGMVLRLSEIAAVYPPRAKKARAARVDANGNPIARASKRSVPLTALDDAAAAAIFNAFDQMVAAEELTAADFETTPTTDDAPIEADGPDWGAIDAAAMGEYEADELAIDDDKAGTYANTGEQWDVPPAEADDEAYQGEPGADIEAQVATPKAKKTPAKKTAAAKK